MDADWPERRKRIQRMEAEDALETQRETARRNAGCWVDNGRGGSMLQPTNRQQRREAAGMAKKRAARERMAERRQQAVMARVRRKATA